MAGTGPAPKHPHQRARRNSGPALIKLPARGRSGKPPEWPLRDDISKTVEIRQLQDKVEDLRSKLNDEPPARTRTKLERLLDDGLARVAVLEAELAEQRDLEAELWVSLWKTPQASATRSSTSSAARAWSAMSIARSGS